MKSYQSYTSDYKSSIFRYKAEFRATDGEVLGDEELFNITVSVFHINRFELRDFFDSGVCNSWSSHYYFHLHETPQSLALWNKSKLEEILVPLPSSSLVPLSVYKPVVSYLLDPFN